MYGKTALKAYQKGPQYGKFNSLYGTGDHPSEGGSVVKGVSGPIHVMAGVESDIMKEHGTEGEYILMQKQGYNSFAEVPVNETTGYLQYGWRDLLKSGWDRITGSSAYEAMDAFAGGYLPGGMQPGEMGWREGMDRYISDPLQQFFNIGEYSDEAARNEQLEKMLGTQTESAIAGQQKMEGFIESNLQEQISQFGSQAEMLSTAGKRLDTKTTGVQAGIAGQYGGARDITQKTGLVVTSPVF